MKRPAFFTLRTAAYIYLGCFFCLLLYWALFRFYDHDEFEVIHTAWKIGTGQVIYKDFFQHHHPLLYYLCVPVIKIVGENVGVLTVMRLFILAMTTGIFYMVYRIGSEFYSKTTGLIAMLLLSTSMAFMMKTVEIRPDVPQTLLSLMAVYLILSYYRTRIPRKLVVAGIILGLAFLMLQKAAFLIILITLLFCFDYVNKRIDWRHAIMVYAGFVATLLPYGVYLLLSGSMRQCIFFNWILNMHFIIRYSPWGVFAYSFMFNGLLCVLYLISLGMFRWMSRPQQIIAFLCAGLIAVLFLNPIPLNQDLMLVFPLVSLCAAWLLWRIQNKRISVGLIAAAIAPGIYFNIVQPLDSNTDQIKKINYVLAITDADDYVYDGDIQFNLYRRDIDYFWFCVPAIATYKVMRGYEYELYDLIGRKKPKVISTYFIIRPQDKRVLSDYAQSDKYPDLYIRK